MKIFTVASLCRNFVGHERMKTETTMAFAVQPYFFPNLPRDTIFYFIIYDIKDPEKDVIDIKDSPVSSGAYLLK